MRRVVLLVSSLIASGYQMNVVLAQEACFTDEQISRLIVDFQTASLICPKWKPLHRSDFVYMLVERQQLGTDALEKSDKAGLVLLKEPCSRKLGEIESASFKEAEVIGLEKFCLRTSFWLTAPHMRYSLEQSGAFGEAN